MAQETDPYQSFRAPRVISIWLGNFKSEDELLRYLENDFRGDFGFAIYAPDAPEQSVHEAGKVDIAELLTGFSSYRSFLSAAVELAHQKGWIQASAAVVFYNFKFDATKVSGAKERGPLTFLGSVPYGTMRETNKVEN